MEQTQTDEKAIETVTTNQPEKKKKKKKKKSQSQNNNNEASTSLQLTDAAAQYVIRFIEDQKLQVQLKWNQDKGRHVIAARSFKPGEVIFEEAAYCASPRSLDEDICFHCLEPLENTKNTVKCSTCSVKGFSMYCSQQCYDNNKVFHDLECPLIEKVISHAVSYTSLDLYKLVLVLRALVRRYVEEGSNDVVSTRFSALLSLETHRDKHEVHQLKVLESSAKFLLLICNDHSPVKLAPEVTVDQVIDLFLIIKMNAIGMGSRGTGVFLLSSLINHSCLENTNHVQRFASHSVTVQMRVIESIKSGQEINFSYLQELYEPTNVRNTHLMKTKYFSCTCSRCRDPTEGGRFLRGIKCNSCATGYYCPKPLSKPQTTKSGKQILYEWKCHSCGATLPEEDSAETGNNNNSPSPSLTYVNEPEVDELVTTALKKLRESNFETGKIFSEGVDLFEKVLNDYAKWYHPYHYTTTLAKVNLTECYMQPSRQNLQRALELADEVIQVGTQILPKYSAVLADFYHTKSTVLRVMAQQARSSAVRKSLLNRGKDVLNMELGILAVCKGKDHFQYKELQHFIQSYGKT